MSWGMRRRLLIFGILIAVIASIGGGTYYLVAHKPPTCEDNKQNQGEEGVDCGGPCSYLCTESQAAPSVRFVRPLTLPNGRTDVIAYVDNPNSSSAAKSLAYHIELYSPTNTVIARKDGRVDLPPNSTVPVYVPNFFSGSEDVARAFLTFDTPQHFWYHYVDDRNVPSVTDIRFTNTPTPRITATTNNSGTYGLRNITFIVTAFDDSGNAVASSQTVAAMIPPRGSTPLVFTWSEPFTATISRIEVLPLVPLPSP